MGKSLIVANVRKMRKLVARLGWDPPEGVWTAYGERNTYTDEDARRKDDFVRDVARSREWGLVWDIGQQRALLADRGRGAATVVAFDADQGRSSCCTAICARRGRADSPADAQFGRSLTRPRLARARAPDCRYRGRPETVLALALIHHVTIGANVPVRELVDWLAGLGASLVVEFPTREDPMVQKLLAPKREGLHPDYELGFFERCLGEAFEVERTERLQSGTRVLYFARCRRGERRRGCEAASRAGLSVAVA